MPRKARDLKASLTKKFGFAPTTKGRGPAHEWLQLTPQGVLPVKVMFSHNDPELGDVLLGKICKQLRVTRPYLNGMIDCQESVEAYLAKLTAEATSRQ